MKVAVKIISILGIMFVLFLLIMGFLVEPWLAHKIQESIHKKNSPYIVSIEDVDVSLLRRSIVLDNIQVSTIKVKDKSSALDGKIGSLEIIGVHLWTLITEKNIEVEKIIISNVMGNIVLVENKNKPLITPMDIKVHKISLESIYLMIRKSTSKSVYSIEDAFVHFRPLSIIKKDTLSIQMLPAFDFGVKTLKLVSSDSLYTSTLKEIRYSLLDSSLTIAHIFHKPRYKKYDFTSRQKFQTDCIEAGFGQIHIHAISIMDLLKNKTLSSSSIEIAKMHVDVFRDARREDKHAQKRKFQELLYSAPFKINIDSILVGKGNVVYREHALDAHEPGRISFINIHASIYNVSNDPIYKTKKGALELRGEALLMGKSPLKVFLEVPLYDKENTFSLSGSLGYMDVKYLNPMLIHNAFIYASSSKIDHMKFHFTANNKESNGNMTLLYHGLDIALVNKKTEDTSGFKEKIVSKLINYRALNSNPLPNEEVRVGKIQYPNNSEKFLFSYVFKSILSGIKSSVFDRRKKKR